MCISDKLKQEIVGLKIENAIQKALLVATDNYIALVHKEYAALIECLSGGDEDEYLKATVIPELEEATKERDKIVDYIHSGHKQCPCVWLLNPCKDDCTCAKPFSSAGCSVCGQYDHYPKCNDVSINEQP